MHPTSHPVQVTTAAPLLRLVLILLLVVAAFAGMLVASSAHVGWLALGFALIAGPVAVVVEGRSRSRAERTSRTAMVRARSDLGLA